MAGKSRATKFRKKKQAEGYKSIAVTISPEAVQALSTMKDTFGWTQREAVSNALAFATADISAIKDFIEGRERLEKRDVADRAKDIQDIVGMKRLLFEFEARIAELEKGTSTTGAAVQVNSDITEDNQTEEKTEDSEDLNVSGEDETVISTTPTGKKVKIVPSEPAAQTEEPPAPETDNKQPYVERTVIRPPVQQRIPGVITPEEKNALLDFAARCFVQYGQTISRSRTYRMAQDANLNIHTSEEEFGTFLQTNLSEIRKRFMILKEQQDNVS
ncbi:MAG: hypothetical protein ACNI27_16510 [Desulfovibrio sp.]